MFISVTEIYFLKTVFNKANNESFCTFILLQFADVNLCVWSILLIKNENTLNKYFKTHFPRSDDSHPFILDIHNRTEFGTQLCWEDYVWFISWSCDCFIRPVYKSMLPCEAWCCQLNCLFQLGKKTSNLIIRWTLSIRNITNLSHCEVLKLNTSKIYKFILILSKFIAFIEKFFNST